VHGRSVLRPLLGAARHLRGVHVRRPVTVADEHPEGAQRAPTSESYLLHPLSALDGVVICVTLHGEVVGYFFGRTEEAAAEAATANVIRRLPSESAGAG
jgi:hypothetical protein